MSNGGLKTGQKCLLYGLNFRYSNGPINYVIRPFESQTKTCSKSHMFGFCVFGFQLVTIVDVFGSPVLVDFCHEKAEHLNTNQLF